MQSFYSALNVILYYRFVLASQNCICLSCVQCIVLLEDVDVAFPRGNRSTQSASSGGGGHDTQSTSEVTFSGLLNILDGAVSR